MRDTETLKSPTPKFHNLKLNKRGGKGGAIGAIRRGALRRMAEAVSFCEWAR